MDLLISSIRREDKLQPRKSLDKTVIESYANQVTAGKQFPPVQVVLDRAGVYWLWNGFHRVNAYVQAGKKLIPAEITDGTERDAFRLSLGANAENGLHRSNDDKHRAVELALRDEEFVGFSNVVIAEMCAVDDVTVKNVREKLESTSEIQKSDTRVGKDGKKYKVKEPAQKKSGSEIQKVKPKLYGVTEEVGSLEGEPAATKAGKAAEPVVQDEPPARPLVNPTKDKKGNQIPTNLVPIFSDPVWGEIDATASKLTTLIDRAAKGPGGYFLGRDLESKGEDRRLTSFETAKRQLFLCRPYGVCPSCLGKGCAACYEKGYLAKLVYKQVEGAVKS